jgi:hypothetical protein
VTRVHIVGCHRSGTTLLATLLATCFRVDGAAPDEMGLWEDTGLPREALFVSKKPRDVRLLGRVLSRAPDLWAIYLVRDPRAVITSRVEGLAERWFVGLGTWLACERHAARLAGHPRVLELAYEDLVRDPDGVQRRIEAWAQFLERRHRFGEYERFARPSSAARRAMHGLAAIDPGRNAGWRAHLARIASERLRWRAVDGGLDAALVRRGYEPDDAWTAQLAGVEPVHEPSRTPERDPPWKRADRGLRDWRRVRRALAALGAQPAAPR